MELDRLLWGTWTPSRFSRLTQMQIEALCKHLNSLQRPRPFEEPSPPVRKCNITDKQLDLIARMGRQIETNAELRFLFTEEERAEVAAIAEVAEEIMEMPYKPDVLYGFVL